MSKYSELRANAPKLTIKSDPREVIFKIISVMCDNVYYIKFKKNEQGDFKMDGNGYSLSNFQFNHEKFEIEWEADLQNWGGVTAMINSGTSVIESVISR